jgi:hypothetical protein
MLISCLTTKVNIYWLNAIKLIVIYYQNFIFQSGTTSTLPIGQKSEDFCLFGKSLRHFLIKTMSYVPWTCLLILGCRASLSLQLMQLYIVAFWLHTYLRLVFLKSSDICSSLRKNWYFKTNWSILHWPTIENCLRGQIDR